MSAKSMKHRLIVALFVFFWVVATAVSPALAEEETEPPSPTISFVEESELIFGSPIPSTIDLAINIKDMDNSRAGLKIQIIHLTDETGNSLPVDSIQSASCEYEGKKIQTNTKEQTATRRICLDPANLEWGNYTALLQATLGDLAQTTKTIKLVSGNEVPVAILNSEITVLGIACPTFARTDTLKKILCPQFEDSVAKLVKDTNLITISGYSDKNASEFKKLFENASGTLVSADGAGRVLVRLDKKNSFEPCKYKGDRLTCGETRLEFWGSTKAGTYTGIFYLNTEDQANDATNVQITFKTKDHWLLPSLIILLGLLVSAWITWIIGTRKDNKAQEKTKAVITGKRNELKNRLLQFREEITKLEQNFAYFVEDPDIMAEVEFLLNSSQDESDKKQPIDILTHIESQDLAQRMIVIVPLFVRLRFFYLALYKLHVWIHGLPGKTQGKNDLEKKIESTRQKLWIADSEGKMDKAQDELIHTFIFAHDIYWTNKGKKIQVPPKFKMEMQPVTVKKPRDRSSMERGWDWLVDFAKALPGFLVSLINIPNLLRWAIVLLSGIYIVYATNPTFGAPQDYIYAFLWGSATNAGIEFINKFLGADSGIMSVVSGLTK